ncbi:hypothetical protein GCM10010466_54050 [Planomonospora alba]|uniref:Roadblock/LC7 domain-containing protein n=1 Tax=Planomonospora alba TaxID=161354 RepID=A0ABP6NRI3_9ACTN
MLGIEECLTEVMAIPGALDAILIDQTSGTAVATGGGGRRLDAEKSAAGLSATLQAALDGISLTSPTGAVRINEMIVSADDGLYLLKPLDTVFDGPLVIYVRLDAERANLALARHRLQGLSGRLITT